MSILLVIIFQLQGSFLFSLMKCIPSPQLWFQLPYLEMRCITLQIKPVSIPWDQTSLYNSLKFECCNVKLSSSSAYFALLCSLCSPSQLVPASTSHWWSADNADSFSMKCSGTWFHANGLAFTTQYHKSSDICSQTGWTLCLHNNEDQGMDLHRQYCRRYPYR